MTGSGCVLHVPVLHVPISLHSPRLPGLSLTEEQVETTCLTAWDDMSDLTLIVLVTGILLGAVLLHMPISTEHIAHASTGSTAKSFLPHRLRAPGAAALTSPAGPHCRVLATMHAIFPPVIPATASQIGV